MQTVRAWSSSGAPEMTAAARGSSGPRFSGYNGTGEYALQSPKSTMLHAEKAPERAEGQTS